MAALSPNRENGQSLSLPGAETLDESFDLRRVPTVPGCYLMRDTHEQIIYVGKAGNLRERIRAYLSQTDERYTVKFLMRRVARIDFLVTATEKEALLLENSLIKEHKPRYNIRLKDDKTYVSLRLNVEHNFPRFTVTRKTENRQSRYFGPFSSANAVRQTVKQLQRMFPLRSCTDDAFAHRTRPCLYHQMGQCAAPCVGLVDKVQYHEWVEQAIMVLEGRNTELEKLLMKQMKQYSDTLEFEKAAELRDRLHDLRRTLERQRTVSHNDDLDRDVWGCYGEGSYVECQVLFFRSGRMTGGRGFSFGNRETPLSDILSSVMLQYYAESPVLPDEVLTPFLLDDASSFEDLLTEQRGRKVYLLTPQRGEKRALLDLAERNARSGFEEKRMNEKANVALLEDIQSMLSLSHLPVRIECYDISTTQGGDAVGAMVTFENGEACKQRYRRYAIKDVEGQDDFAMMREILMRRLKRAITEGDLPDLVLLDGGLGQLGVAKAVTQDLGLTDLPLAAIAKSRTENEARSPERFFILGRKNPIVPRQNHPAVLLLARIRDEAHRFAVTYHRKKRKKATLQSTLLGIPGVGEARARMLLRTFGSISGVREASVEDMASLPGFGPVLAEEIKRNLK